MGAKTATIRLRWDGSEVEQGTKRTADSATANMEQMGRNALRISEELRSAMKSLNEMQEALRISPGNDTLRADYAQQAEYVNKLTKHKVASAGLVQMAQEQADKASVERSRSAEQKVADFRIAQRSRAEREFNKISAREDREQAKSKEQRAKQEKKVADELEAESKSRYVASNLAQIKSIEERTKEEQKAAQEAEDRAILGERRTFEAKQAEIKARDKEEQKAADFRASLEKRHYAATHDKEQTRIRELRKNFAEESKMFAKGAAERSWLAQLYHAEEKRVREEAAKERNYQQQNWGAKSAIKQLIAFEAMSAIGNAVPGIGSAVGTAAGAFLYGGPIVGAVATVGAMVGSTIQYINEARAEYEAVRVGIAKQIRSMQYYGEDLSAAPTTEAGSSMRSLRHTMTEAAASIREKHAAERATRWIDMGDNGVSASEVPLAGAELLLTGRSRKDEAWQMENDRASMLETQAMTVQALEMGEASIASDRRRTDIANAREMAINAVVTGKGIGRDLRGMVLRQGVEREAVRRGIEDRRGNIAKALKLGQITQDAADQLNVQLDDEEKYVKRVMGETQGYESKAAMQDYEHEVGLGEIAAKYGADPAGIRERRNKERSNRLRGLDPALDKELIGKINREFRSREIIEERAIAVEEIAINHRVVQAGILSKTWGWQREKELFADKQKQEREADVTANIGRDRLAKKDAARAKERQAFDADHKRQIDDQTASLESQGKVAAAAGDQRIIRAEKAAELERRLKNVAGLDPAERARIIKATKDIWAAEDTGAFKSYALQAGWSRDVAMGNKTAFQVFGEQMEREHPGWGKRYRQEATLNQAMLDSATRATEFRAYGKRLQEEVNAKGSSLTPERANYLLRLRMREMLGPIGGDYGDVTQQNRRMQQGLLQNMPLDTKEWKELVELRRDLITNGIKMRF